MTDTYRAKVKALDRANLKEGCDHILDTAKEQTDTNRGRDESGWIRKGLGGIFDIRRLSRIQQLDEEIEWHVANPDRPTSSSPMNQPIDLDKICRQAKLSDPQREAMVMWLQGDSLLLIAEELGISKGAVQARLNWGRLKLKVAFGDLGLDFRTT